MCRIRSVSCSCRHRRYASAVFPGQRRAISTLWPKPFVTGELGRLKFSKLEDQEIIDAIVKVPGLGIWSAEMFLIFSVGRADIFSIGDLALRNGVQRVIGRELKRAEIEAIAQRWSPYRSIASLYLWKIAHWQQ